MYIVFSDVHSNTTALKEFYNYIKKHYTTNNLKVIFIGDLIGYLTTDDELLNIIEEMKKNISIRFVVGNHDEAFIRYMKNINEEKSDVLNNTIEANIIYRERLMKIYELFQYNPIKITVGGKKIVLSHGGISNSINSYYYENSDFQKILDVDDSFDIYVMGHTHRPFIKKIRNRLFVNTGSLGMPRDTNIKISYLEIDGTAKCKIKRIKYDIDEEYSRNKGIENSIRNRVYYGSNSKYIGSPLIKFSKEERIKLIKRFGQKNLFDKGIYFKQGKKESSLIKVNVEEKGIKYIYTNKTFTSEFDKIDEIIKRRCR